MGFTGDMYRTPGGSVEYVPSEVIVIELADNILEVRDPLFEHPYRIGDGSLITDPVAEAVVLHHWQHNGVGLSTRQLTNTEQFATKKDAERWSRMGHMLSVAALTAHFGGTSGEVIAAALHDAGHRLGSHRTDDLLAGRGSENAHDGHLFGYLERTGFLRRLEAAGIMDAAGNVADQNGLNIHDVLDHDESTQPTSYVNQPGSAQSIEVERLQYIAHEAAIWIHEPALVREAVSHAVRATHAQHGEHIVFDDAEAAHLIATSQIRCNTEHWNDPLNDVIDELLMTLDRRLLLSQKYADKHDPALISYYPGDVMYSAEEDWQDHYQNLANSDAFASAILKIATNLAKQQKSIHEHYDNNDAYRGPVYPSWARQQSAFDTSRAHTVQGVSKGRGQFITIEMVPGKLRRVDPWVINIKGGWSRVSDVIPEIETYRQVQDQWRAKGPYDVIINYDSPQLGLSASEKRSISPAIRDIKQRWRSAINRPAMPDELLAQRVAQASRITRERGRVPTAPLAAESMSA